MLHIFRGEISKLPDTKGHFIIVIVCTLRIQGELKIILGGPKGRNLTGPPWHKSKPKLLDMW